MATKGKKKKQQQQQEEEEEEEKEKGEEGALPVVLEVDGASHFFLNLHPKTPRGHTVFKRRILEGLVSLGWVGGWVGGWCSLRRGLFSDIQYSHLFVLIRIPPTHPPTHPPTPHN